MSPMSPKKPSSRCPAKTTPPLDSGTTFDAASCL
jgi:hypothetical protein